MPDSLHEIPIQATPQKVYDAWTTPEGQTSWWTRECTIHTQPGQTNIFVFDQENVKFYFRIDEQVPNKKLHWTGIAGEKMPEEWVGTTIEVEIVDKGKGQSLLRFGHKNWKSGDGAFALCNTTWGELMYRLRDYCEGKARGPLFSG